MAENDKGMERRRGRARILGHWIGLEPWMKSGRLCPFKNDKIDKKHHYVINLKNGNFNDYDSTILKPTRRHHECNSFNTRFQFPKDIDAGHPIGSPLPCSTRPRQLE
jgi:hypothetical protein